MSKGAKTESMDVSPDNFIQLLGILSHELNAVGLALGE